MQLRAILIVPLLVLLPSICQACEAPNPNTGKEFALGLNYGDTPDQVFCSLKKQFNHAEFRVNYFPRPGTYCRGVVLDRQLWRLSDFKNFNDLFSNMNVAIDTLTASQEPVFRKQSTDCYRQGWTIARIVDLVKGSDAIDKTVAIFDLALNFGGIEYLGLKGQLRPTFSSGAVGLATLLNDLQNSRPFSSLTLSGVNHGIIITLSELEFTSDQVRDPTALEAARRSSTQISKQLRDTYGGEVSREGADTVYTRDGLQVLYSFNDATGVNRIRFRGVADQDQITLLRDQPLKDRVLWIRENRVKGR